MNNSGFKEERWLRMMGVSLVFHLAILSTTLFVPHSGIRYPSIEGRVYEVELVGPPSGSTRVGKVKAAPTSRSTKSSQTSKGKTRRIYVDKKKNPRILAKRVSPKAVTKERSKDVSASELVDKAIAKIQKSVEEDKTNRLEDALSRIEKKVGEEKATDLDQGADEPGGDVSAVLGRQSGLPGVPSGMIGAGIQLYQMEIETAIKNNWSYPVALFNVKKGDIPEAVVIVTLRNDGKILKTWFKSRSSNPLFDDSVMKAIEKSDPLPPFPPGYKKSYEEVEINFSLKDFV
jgi:colicin import membrane protein